jgi:hypothetical protein
MPVWGWILIPAAVVIVAAVIVAAISARRRKRTHRLQEHFGPEYERTVLEAGEQRTAEKELAARERKRAKLDIVALTPEALEKYANRWQIVQTAFVDNPSSAVADADQLVTEVMRERGYPVDDFDQQAADISVDHPTVVENYRAAHNIHCRSATAMSAPRRSVRRSFTIARSSTSCFRHKRTPTPHRRQPHDNSRSRYRARSFCGAGRTRYREDRASAGTRGVVHGCRGALHRADRTERLGR